MALLPRETKQQSLHSVSLAAGGRPASEMQNGLKGEGNQARSLMVFIRFYII